MRTFANLRLEVSRLRQLYFTTKYASNETASSVSDKLKRGEIDGNAKLYFQGKEQDDYLISSSIFALGHRLSRQLPRYLRELIFVRIISALEIFLVDSVAEVFAINKKPFKSNYNIQILQAELLSAESLSDIFTRVIVRECRSLHGGGFGEIKKYYRKTLGIDFAVLVDVLKLEEYHDRRHLLVHQLGKTDTIYQKKHNTKQKTVTVDEKDLLESIDVLLAFANSVNERLDDICKDVSPAKIKPANYNCKLILILETESARNFVLPTWQFWADNRLVFLRDILTSSRYLDEGTIELDLQGDQTPIKNYLKQLKKYEKTGELTILAREAHNLEPCKLSADDIVRIRTSLPAKPWPVNIHKTIALGLGLKTSEVYKAINQIIKEDDLHIK
ncbi:MAG: hypothetical protein FJ006_11315 [Chloroflexi bacterium]|nr:hypothetical protein [Chloroflexota bacterium]MBM4453907.1 hypothetical protein [Chloroflexota bacterium]